MNRRDAVLRALRHEDARPVPYQLSLTEELERRIVAKTGDPSFVAHTGNYLAEARNESFTTLSPTCFRDQFGVPWDRRQEGDFGIVAEYPLKEPALGDYRFPEPDAALIRKKCEELVARRDLFTMYTIGFSLFERAWSLRSMEGVLTDMLLEPDFLCDLLDRIVRYNLAVVDIAAEYPIDCIFFGDDWGQQNGLIMGEKHWRRFFRPRLEAMYAHVKAKGMFVAQHSCGDCRSIFGDLVDIGMDIYNTFQPEVYDIVDFKNRFGNKVTFYGGISTQRLLPFATPDEVRKETRRILSILGRDGGYILAPTHAMSPDIPTENVMAFLDVAQNQ